MPPWFSSFKLVFSFSCLGIYDITGCNRQDKTIHHAGLMWESKFNLVSLIYKYWPFLGTHRAYLLECKIQAIYHAQQMSWVCGSEEGSFGALGYADS